MKLLVRDFQGCVSFLVLYVKFQDKVVMIVFLLFFQFIVMKLLGFSKKKKKNMLVTVGQYLYALCFFL